MMFSRANRALLLVATWSCLVPAIAATAGEADAQKLAFFESKIRPVLVEKCYECHSPKAKKIKGGLLLNTREGILRGGDTGPAVVPGDLKRRLLIEAIHHEGTGVRSGVGHQFGRGSAEGNHLSPKIFEAVTVDNVTRSFSNGNSVSKWEMPSLHPELPHLFHVPLSVAIACLSILIAQRSLVDDAVTGSILREVP